MRKSFDISCCNRDTIHRAQHGDYWTKSDDERLTRFFHNGCHLAQLCDVLERSSGGIIPRLEKLNLIEYDSTLDQYWIIEDDRTKMINPQEIFDDAAAEIESERRNVLKIKAKSLLKQLDQAEAVVVGIKQQLDDLKQQIADGTA